MACLIGSTGLVEASMIVPVFDEEEVSTLERAGIENESADLIERVSFGFDGSVLRVVGRLPVDRAHVPRSGAGCGCLQSACVGGECRCRSEATRGTGSIEQKDCADRIRSVVWPAGIAGRVAGGRIQHVGSVRFAESWIGGLDGDLGSTPRNASRSETGDAEVK